MLSPSEKLGTFGPWAWLVDLKPWQALLVMLFISPVVIKFVMRPLIEGRMVIRPHEFLSFHFDMFLAPALVAGLTLVHSAADRIYVAADHWVHPLLLGLATLGGIVHFLMERKMYSWGQLFSITKIYHELLPPFIGYLLLLIAYVGVVHAPWTLELILMRLMFFACIGAWVWALVYDAKHAAEDLGYGMNRFDYAHIEQSWPWQHKYQHLAADFYDYLDDWREVPGRLRRLVRL